MSNIPEDLLSLCVGYFGNDSWFYIKHPKLNYKSPIRLLQQDVNLVRETLKDDLLDRINLDGFDEYLLQLDVVKKLELI